MKYVGYQGELPVFVAGSREEIEAVKHIVFDTVEEVENAEIVNGKVLLGDEIETEKQAQALAHAKAERASAVEALTVEVNGKVFDADELSQGRMSVAASSMSDFESNAWVLHDNSVVYVTKAELLEACRLARIAQSSIWTKPYENAST